MWNRTEDQITLLFIRHGATEANREHRYLGWTDEPLCEEGRQALARARGEGRYPGVELLFASPMKRCLETGEILYPSKEPQVIPEWREMDFGAFEGKNYRELQTDQRYQDWIDSGGTLPFPEGEGREEFVERCLLGWERMKTELARACRKKEGPVSAALVVHGGTIMALLSELCGGEYFAYQIAAGRGYQCTLHPGREYGQLEIVKKL